MNEEVFCRINTEDIVKLIIKIICYNVGERKPTKL